MRLQLFPLQSPALHKLIRAHAEQLAQIGEFCERREVAAIQPVLDRLAMLVPIECAVSVGEIRIR